ncbi:glycoside hydrolase family 3 protein, partial [Apiospora rasikravindrae]
NVNQRWIGPERTADTPSQKDSFLDALISNMTMDDLVLQVHLMFAGEIIGVESKNELYGIGISHHTMRFTPGSPIGVIHDWYTLNTSQYNELQQLNLNKSRLKIPLLHTAECLHGVGSFKQSMFPQSLGLSASFDTDLVYRVGRAIAKEARSTGIHACFSPVLDIGQDPRWGRMQGISWSEPDAVVPVMKHFAAHGSPQSGRNAAPFMGHGNRQVLQDLLTPFKAAVQLGGARGVMMAYNEFDDIPASVHPMLYKALEDWGYDGFVMADDTGMIELETMHNVAHNPADAIAQWFNAGGMLQFYDYSLETYLNVKTAPQVHTSIGSPASGGCWGVKWDLGLFQNPFIPEDSPDPLSLVQDHRDLTLEAAQKSIVLLENRNNTLPLKPGEQNISRIALIGPFTDTMNYGDYSGAWGQYPAGAAKTLREGLLAYTKASSNDAKVELVSSWGANTWEYNGQYVIPPYLLSANGTKGGLRAKYFADPNFEGQTAERMETPALDWGMYPPPGLPSNNFSAIWEGELESPVDLDVNGWIGVAVGPNTTVKLYVDENLVLSHGTADQTFFDSGTVMGNILQYTFIQANSTQPPPGSAPFTFRKGETYRIRIEYQAYNLHRKIENVSSLNSQMILFWNLVDRNGDDALTQATQLAATADLVVLAVGAAWNSDGESGNRATLGLSPSQDALARAVYATGKPVVLILQGGRPFAIPEYYASSAAVLSAFFPDQSGGQAIADVLFGKASPGGRMPVTVARHVGQLPVYYNFKRFARKNKYLDIDSEPLYWFGYGLSYTTLVTSEFGASTSTTTSLVQEQRQQLDNMTTFTTFTSGETITFSVNIQNNGTMSGSFVAQVYLLARVSSVVQPVKQLVAFRRVYLEAREGQAVTMELDVDRYLTIYNRWNEWELEKGEYIFSLLAHGGSAPETGLNITMLTHDSTLISFLTPNIAFDPAYAAFISNAIVMSWKLLPAELRWKIISHFELPRLELGRRLPSPEFLDKQAVLWSLCLACRSAAVEARALLYRTIIIFMDDEEVANIVSSSSRPTDLTPEQHDRLCVHTYRMVRLLRTLTQNPGLRRYIKYLACPLSVGGVPHLYPGYLYPGSIKHKCSINMINSSGWPYADDFSDTTGFERQVLDMAGLPIPPRSSNSRHPNQATTEDSSKGALSRPLEDKVTQASDQQPCTVVHDILGQYLSNGATVSAVLPKLTTLQLQVHEPPRNIQRRTQELSPREVMDEACLGPSMVSFDTVCALLTLPTLRHVETWCDDGFQSFFDRHRDREPQQLAEPRPRISHREWLPKIESLTLSSAFHHCGYFYAACEMATNLRRLDLDPVRMEQRHRVSEFHSDATLNAALRLRADTLEELRLDGFAHHPIKHLGASTHEFDTLGLDCFRHMPKLRFLSLDIQLLFGSSKQVQYISLPSVLPPNLERLDLRDAWSQFHQNRPDLFRHDPDKYAEALVMQFQNLAEMVRPRQAQQPLSRLHGVHLRPDAPRMRQRVGCNIPCTWLDDEQLGTIKHVLGQAGVTFTYDLPPSLDGEEMEGV